MSRVPDRLRRPRRPTELYLEVVRDLAPELAGLDQYRRLDKQLGRALDEDQLGSPAAIAETLYELLRATEP